MSTPSGTHDDEWYWDLGTQQAVRAEDRGPGDRTLGPYASRAEAENWKETSEKRNEAWDDADEAWDRTDDDE